MPAFPLSMRLEIKFVNDDNDELPKGTQRLDTPLPAPFMKGEPPLCSFCGRGKGEYRRLVAAVKGNICDLCVATARAQLAKESGSPS
jgi:hypothetical protein